MGTEKNTLECPGCGIVEGAPSTRTWLPEGQLTPATFRYICLVWEVRSVSDIDDDGTIHLDCDISHQYPTNNGSMFRCDTCYHRWAVPDDTKLEFE